MLVKCEDLGHCDLETLIFDLLQDGVLVVRKGGWTDHSDRSRQLLRRLVLHLFMQIREKEGQLSGK